MEILSDAFAWLNDPLNWTGRNGVIALTAAHLQVTLLAVLLAAVVALPAGVWLGHARRGGTLGVVVANTTRALPTLALLTLFASAGLFGNTATVLACAIFAIPPLLTNTVTGLGDVDRDIVDAARGLGMSGRRRLVEIELPLAVPLIAAGVRTAVVQVLATVPLAALVGGTSLGTIVVTGFGTQRYGQVLAGGILVAGLCLVAEGLLAIVQRLLTPRGLRESSRPARGWRRQRSPGVPVAATASSSSNGPAPTR
ncbi:ABC transporter permease [Cellulomonas rhizosphaerae]|uniref:ABC transporter permease subunit n=1 Tax=Cellulomonas rhizosphaerae TaxID=2293719 RepID=A0A413RR05_9CELL|nr:ABC transporter permease subunit [Cellulomonas rhizosphaerae]RHA44374.1 ABC transporter permease subunit [Cellulomonas rhizosphaerae]